MAQDQPLDWNIPSGFSAFAGNARLDAHFMKETRFENTDKPDFDIDILRFHKWVDLLRADPGSGGIPQDYINDVKILPDEFFPSAQGTLQDWVSPKRVRDIEYPPSSGEREADPCTVHLGPEKTPLKIIEAGTALGYIFTVVRPPMENPTWQNYFLPLQALFCRCLYLGFIHYRSESPESLTYVAEVPIMSCIMYVGDEARPRRHFYGCTWVTAPSSTEISEALRLKQQEMLDKWRRKEILKPALQHVPQEPGNEPASIPTYTPRYLEHLTAELFKSIRQAPILAEAFRISWATLSKEFLAFYKKGFPQNPVLHILDLDRLRGHKIIHPNLGKLVRAIATLRFDDTYNNNTSLKVSAAFKAFLTYYLTPHAFEVIDTKFLIELEEPSGFAAVRNEAIESTWAANAPTLLEVLDKLHEKHAQSGFRQNTPFGRCAETYCIISLLPNYFSWIGQEGASMSHVRGISMNVIVVGSSSLFQNAFTSVELGKAGSKGPYRLPCANCQALLPIYKAVMGWNAYDEDLIAIPSTIAPPH